MHRIVHLPGALVHTIALRYCSARGLVKVGILPQPSMDELYSQARRQYARSAPVPPCRYHAIREDVGEEGYPRVVDVLHLVDSDNEA